MNKAEGSAPSSVTYLQGGCWPTPAQKLLLLACLSSGSIAGEAWEQWRARHSIDYIDAASFRLLGLLYSNLSANRIETPDLPRLKGIYRYFWARYQRTLHFSRPVIQSLRDAGIPLILSKGAALNLTVYQNGAIRPMDDIDFLVPIDHAHDAIRRIEDAGWKSPFGSLHHMVDVAHACGFDGPEGAQLDLHWHLLRSDCSPAADEEFWKRSLPAAWQNVPVRILSPADQLLHTCEHGARYNLIAPLRWLADAAFILKSQTRLIDWNCLVETAAARDVTLPVYQTLKYLFQEMGGDVPDDVLRRLQKQRPSLLARANQFVLRMPTPRGITFWNQLPAYTVGYLRLKRSVGWRGLLEDWVAYLELVHNLDRPLGSYIANEIRVAWHAALNRLRATMARWKRDSPVWYASMPQSGITWDVYAPEVFENTMFCWTKAHAVFTLSRPANCRQVQLKMLPLNELWKNLEARGIQILVDGAPAENIVHESETGILRFDLPSPLQLEARRLCLILKFNEPLRPEGDHRRLGLPLCEIRLLSPVGRK